MAQGIGPSGWQVGAAAAREGTWVPGSAEAEAASDTLLMRAKGCGMRVVWSLRRAARDAGPRGEGLRRAADEIAISCAYYTEAGARRRCRAEVRLVADPAAEEEEGTPGGRGVDWLSGLVEEGLARLADSVGLSPQQTEVWIRHVLGEAQEETARRKGVSRGAVAIHLGRAYRRIDESWLAAYRRGVRAPSPRARRGRP